MGAWGWVKARANDVADGAKTVGGAAVDGVKTIGGVAVDGATALGETAIDAGAAVAEHGPSILHDAVNAAKIPFRVGGEVIRNGADWAGDRIADGLDTIGLDPVGTGIDWFLDRTGEKIQGIIERDLSFPDRLERLGKDLFSSELWNDPSNWGIKLGTNIVNASAAPAAVETLFDILKFNTRGLSDAEVEVAKSVFGDSINYNAVRIDEGSAIALLNEHLTPRGPFTSLHTINLAEDLDMNDPNDAKTLIHELTHIWQYEQRGLYYVYEAAHDKGEYGFGGDDAIKAAVQAKKDFSDFGMEQQASIVARYYEIKMDSDSGNDKYIKDYAHYVKEVSTLPLSELEAPAFSVIAQPLQSGAFEDETSLAHGRTPDEDDNDEREWPAWSQDNPDGGSGRIGSDLDQIATPDLPNDVAGDDRGWVSDPLSFA